MKKQYESELAAAKTAYDQNTRDANRFGIDQGMGLRAEADSMYTSTVAGIEARYQSIALTIQDTLAKLTIQKQQLLAQKAKLMAAAPKVPTN